MTGRAGCAAVGLMIGWLGSVAPTLAAPADEYAVKAAFLLNFSRFVEWPEGAFPAADAPLRICVLGDDPFGAVLDRTVAGEVVSGRTVTIARSAEPVELRDCQVVFVSRSERPRLDAVFDELSGAPILTVGEVEGFAGRGGSINFFLESHRVRFEVNPGAASRAGLRISSELLRLGRIVEEPPTRERS